MNRIKLLHLVSDYPDHSQMNSTKAVANLISATSAYIEHRIIAYRRIRFSGFKWEVSQDYDYLQAPSLPYGFGHVLISFLTALFVAYRYRTKIDEFDFIHAHKLTIDGVVAYFVSKLLGIRYILSVRADTDLKFVRNKPMTRWLFRRVYCEAEHVFYVSAWGRKELEERLSVQKKSFGLLPNIIQSGDFSSTTDCELNVGSNTFVFIGRLESAQKKGLHDVLRAISNNSKYKLHIYGSANNKELDELKQVCKKFNVYEQVSYQGLLSKRELFGHIDKYCALLMPSINETFGMVYVEALLNNLPVLGCKSSGIDGYINNASYFKCVPYGSDEMIFSEIEHFAEKEEQIKSELRRDIESGKLDLFTIDNISNEYYESIREVNERVQTV